MKKREILVEPEDIYKTTKKSVRTIRTYQVKYMNLILFSISILIAFQVLGSEKAVSFIENLGNFGYPASFVAGMAFSYGITTVPATATLFKLVHMPRLRNFGLKLAHIIVHYL